MIITLYKSSLCPRCHLAKKYLFELAAAHSDIHVEEIDIVKNPRRVWQDGIRMIPALKTGDQILSSLFLKKSDISTFIHREKKKL